MKKTKSLILAGALALTTLTACNPKPQVDTSSATNLDVFCFNAGYGVEWAEQQVKAFANEAWVKEKQAWKGEYYGDI